MKPKLFVIVLILLASLHCMSQYDNNHDVIPPFTGIKSMLMPKYG